MRLEGAFTARAMQAAIDKQALVWSIMAMPAEGAELLRFKPSHYRQRSKSMK